MKSIAISQVLEAVGKLVFGLLFSYIGLYLNYSVAYVSALSIFGITLGTVIGTLFLYVNYKRNARFCYNSPYKAKNIIKKIFKISIPITLSASVLSVSNVIDLSVIMRGLENNGLSEQDASSLYGNYTTLAVPMLNLIVSLITPVAIAALPKLRELHLSGQGKEFVIVLNKTVRVIGFLTVPCAVFFYLCPFTILDTLFSSVASLKGAITLSLLAPSVVFLPLLTIINTAHEARENFYSPIISTTIGVLCKLLFSILMVKSLGILAAPIGTGISYFVSLCLSFFAFGREYKFKILNLYLPGICLAFVAIVIPYLLIFMIESFSLFWGVEYFYIVFSSFAYLLLSFMCQLFYKRHKNKQ
jgi:stage V sporulation protein B